MKTGTIPPRVRERVLDAVRSHFKPEFLNRLDDIVMFHPLTPSQLSAIVSLILKQLGERLAGQERAITLTGATPAALKFILYEATKEQPEYGARPIKRWVEKHVTTTMASLIVQGRLPSHSSVQLDVDGTASRLAFNVTTKQGKHERIVVDLKQPSGSSHHHAADVTAGGGGGEGAGRKRNVGGMTDEFIAKDKKSTRAKSLGIRDDDMDSEEDEQEKMEL